MSEGVLIFIMLVLTAVLGGLFMLALIILKK